MVVLVVVGAFAASLRLGLVPLAAAPARDATAIEAGRLGRRDPADVLARAQNALLHGEDARRVLGRLRGVEAAGRAGLRLRVARRCLERAGRQERLEEAMRGEAVRRIGEVMVEADGRRKP